MNVSPQGPPAAPHPVFVRRGDATAEVERLVAAAGGGETAGLQRSIYVTRANQTVVMVTGRETPLARALRAAGWEEPQEDSSA